MTPKARKRRAIVYMVEQTILCMVSIGCFCVFLKLMSWLLTFAN